MKELKTDDFKFLLGNKEKVLGLVTVDKSNYHVILMPVEKIKKIVKEIKK